MLASTHPSIVLLTPKAALIGLAFLFPLAAFVLRERRSAAVRTTLGIEPPPLGRRALRPLLLVVVAALIAGTAAQPAVRTTRSARMRSDAQLYFIFDVSRSMLASPAARSPDRFDRARAIA